MQQLMRLAIPYSGIFPVYKYLFVVGWLTLLIFGVVYWMFPKYTSSLPRGNGTLGWVSFILLNAGMFLRVVSEPAISLVRTSGTRWGIMLAISAVLQLLGGLALLPIAGHVLRKNKIQVMKTNLKPGSWRSIFMHRLSVLFIRASQIYLAIGLTLGALILANKGVGFYPKSWQILPLHIEVLLVGWFLQLTLGMIFWIFLRFTSESPRGKEKLSELAFILINLGIGWVIAENIIGLAGLELIGRLAETAGIVVFYLGSWQRVKPFAR